MLVKHYYYEVAVTTRPDGTMQPVVGIISQFVWQSPQRALQSVKDFIAAEYEVNYGYFIREFRTIR